MDRLQIFLLGPPRVDLDGEPIQVDTRKAIALLAYLAVSGEVQTRDHLAYLFWPDFDSARARAALRRTLSTLKKALKDGWLVVDRSSIGLDRKRDYWLDVDRFRELLAVEDLPPQEALESLDQAAGLYRDDFLSGFTLRDSLGFDDWQRFQEESLRRELDTALEQLVQRHSALGDYERALGYARRWLALDPLREEAHRQLMRLYTWSGQRNAALQQYRQCVRILEEELGVPPLEETTSLYKLVKENNELPAPAGVAGATQALPLAAGSVEAARRGAGYPLVGREDVWAALEAFYRRIEQDGQFVLIEGEIGIGKTRLAEEFLAQVRAQGGRVLAMRCYDGESGLAYGPFVEGIRRAMIDPSKASWIDSVSPHSLSDAARLIPELLSLRPNLPDPPPLEGPGAQIRFLESLGQVVKAISAGPQPGLLFLDDAQWADEASLDLLVYLVRRLERQPLGILVTLREEGVGGLHRLQGLQAEVQRRATGSRLSLTRLLPKDVQQLAAHPKGLALEPEAVARLYQESEGIPFFVVEYLSMLAELDPAGKEEAWSLPGGIRELFHARLAGLDETSRQLLSSAAVISRSFDYDTLRFTSGRSEEEMVDGLEKLTAAGLIIELAADHNGGSSTYDFDHQKMRNLVYSETSLARRRLLHRRVAESFIERRRSKPELDALAGQVAFHYQQAGEENLAGEYYLRAGEHARAVYANAEAVAHFRAALAMGAADPARLYGWIGDLQTLIGEYRPALSSYAAAAAHSSPAGLPSLEHRLGIVHHRLGEWELAESYYRSSLQALTEAGPPVALAEIYADWSLTAHRQGQADQAQTLAERALELAESSGEGQSLARALNLNGILARNRGELLEARRFLDKSLAHAEAFDDLGARVAALNNLAHVYADEGELERAQSLLEQALALCIQIGDRHREAALHNNLADLFHESGHQTAAMDHLKRAVAIFAEIGGEEGALQPEIWMLVEW